ncbi:hypothetical protein BH23PAT2_BH23PAT2_07710 [soil metagenome]
MALSLYQSQESYLTRLGGRPYLFAEVGCFVKDTLVWTPQGRRFIQTLKSGEPIYAYDGAGLIETTVDFMAKISNKPKPMIQFRYEKDAKPIRCTYDHPFFDGEKYYPLYQLAWRDMEASQRVQLKLLCEQYGQVIDDTASRGLSHSDNETWSRQVGASSNGDERKDGQSPSSNSTNVDSKSQELSVYQPQGLQPSQQQFEQSRVVYPETEQPTRIQKRQAIGIVSNGSKSPKTDAHNSSISQYLGLDKYRFKQQRIRQITSKDALFNQGSDTRHTYEQRKIYSIQILEAEPYYAVDVNKIHTYIVGDGLPTHNTGKTLMTLFRAHRSGARKVLVVCPASVRDTRVWELDLEKSGLQFDQFEVQGFSFLQKFKKVDFSKYSDHYVIIDEAHKIKNSQSLQGMGAWKLCGVTNRDYSFLSGTPMSKWADAVNYAKITGLVKHKTEFYKRFVVEQRSYAHKGMDIVGYRDTDTLVKWWNNIALRLKAEECIELPRKQIINVSIPVKRTEYLSMIKNRIGADGDPLDNAPKLNWALRRCAESAPEKLNWVVEKVEGLQNCLIFVNTIGAIEGLGAKFKKAGIKYGVWHGAKKDKFADQDVMIVQYQSGGTGLNLQKFNTTIFLSPCYSFQDYTQAVGRTYRNGQANKCTFYQLRSANTIDGAIYKALGEKKSFDDKLTGVSQADWMEIMS